MARDNIRLLADIASIIGTSRGPDETLQRIVEQVAARFGVEVCSVYLLNDNENELVLEATVGLNPDAVDTIHMKIHEGLTGLVLEDMAPVFEVDPAAHDRYKFFEGSGEEIYKTFLGVPLVYLQRTVGVLVVQTVKETAVTEADIPVFSAILAKSFEIPMVVGAKDILEVVKENDFLIVDGTSGLVFDNPPQAIMDEFAHLKTEKAEQWRRLDLLRDQEARTKDGFEIRLGANIGLLSDLELVKKYGADHIGLYRTEFPFLARKDFPSEEEQAALYRKIVEGAGNRPVTIRTLDVGGDKFLSYLDSPKEQNPFLGWRSIRVSLAMDDMFRTQLRAILGASAFGKASLLFPMITSVREVRRSLEILSEEKEALRGRGIVFDENMAVGVMVEVPAALGILDKLLRYVDFVSIGTNDLVQYLLAVDRNNEKVAVLYNPLHPAVIKAISEVLATCRTLGKPVSICGEAAADLQSAFLFLAMEADRLSMNAASVPIVKDFLRKASLAEAKGVLKQVLEMDDTEEIVALVDGIVKEING